MSVSEHGVGSRIHPEEKREVVRHSLSTELEIPRNLLSEEPQSDMKDGSEQDSHAPFTRKITGLPWAVLVIGLVCANLLISMDNTIVADIQAPIIEELGEIRKFPWISVGFELGAASANIFWGQLYRHFNIKALFIEAVIVFEIGSAICGSAKSLDFLIIGRVICGLGGTGVFIGVMNSISSLTTAAERSLYVSFPGATWAIGAIIGPIIGGAINDSSAGWRWCFYINVVVGGLCLPVYLFLLPPISDAPNSSILTRLCRLDLLGFILWAGALNSLVMAISFGGTLFTWQGRSTISLFVATGILWTTFCVQQKWAILTTKEYRLFPVHLLSWDINILFMQIASGIAALFLPLYFIPLYFQFTKSDSALMTGVRLLPFIIFFIFFLLLNGSVMGKTGLYMPWYLVGSALVTIGSGLMHLVSLDSSASMVYGFSIIVGAGAGAFVQASFGIAQAKASPKDIPTAVAFIGCAQITGVVLCFAIAYSVFLNTATNQITVLLPQASIDTIHATIAGVGANVFDTLAPMEKTRVLEAIVDSIKNVWIQVLVSGGLCFLLSLIMKRERLALKKR